MSTTNPNISGTVTSNDSTTTSYSSSRLAQLFANFLLGSASRDIVAQKYIQLYKLTAEELISEYEKNGSFPADDALLADPIPVRAAHLSKVTNITTADEYYATFIATIDGTRVSVPSIGKTPVSLGLQVGSSLLAAATFDNEVYNTIKNRSRAEIRWKLGVSSTSTIQGDS